MAFEGWLLLFPDLGTLAWLKAFMTRLRDFRGSRSVQVVSSNQGDGMNKGERDQVGVLLVDIEYQSCTKDHIVCAVGAADRPSAYAVSELRVVFPTLPWWF